MDKHEICEAVEKILRDTYPGADLRTPFDRIEGMDSLDYICFVADVESAFDTKIPRDQVANFENAAGLCEWLEAQ